MAFTLAEDPKKNTPIPPEAEKRKWSGALCRRISLFSSLPFFTLANVCKRYHFDDMLMIAEAVER